MANCFLTNSVLGIPWFFQTYCYFHAYTVFPVLWLNEPNSHRTVYTDLANRPCLGIWFRSLDLGRQFHQSDELPCDFAGSVRYAGSVWSAFIVPSFLDHATNGKYSKSGKSKIIQVITWQPGQYALGVSLYKVSVGLVFSGASTVSMTLIVVQGKSSLPQTLLSAAVCNFNLTVMMITWVRYKNQMYPHVL